MHTNIVLTGNEILFIFLRLHLPKQFLCENLSIGKKYKLSANAFTKTYFLFSQKSAGGYKKALGMWIQKRNRKIEFLLKRNHADCVKPRTHCSSMAVME